VEILSGVFEGVTTGTPIALLIRNQDARSKDYGEHRRRRSARATPITPTGRSTASAITAAAAGSRRARPRCGWRPARSREVAARAPRVEIRGYMSQLGPIAIPFK
jgi:chorismate synthase